jgi:hypothetical protein
MSIQLAPYRGAVAVTPGDSTDIPVTRALFIGGAGNVVVRTVKGEQVTLTGVLAGTVYPIAVDRVLSTSTTATNIVALY